MYNYFLLLESVDYSSDRGPLIVSKTTFYPCNKPEIGKELNERHSFVSEFINVQIIV